MIKWKYITFFEHVFCGTLLISQEPRKMRFLIKKSLLRKEEQRLTLEALVLQSLRFDVIFTSMIILSITPILKEKRFATLISITISF